MSTEIQTTHNDLKAVQLAEPQGSAMLFDLGMFAQVEKVGQIMASGVSTIPEHLRGCVGDCVAVAMQAVMWRMNPWAVAQKTHMVSGKIGYESQLVAAAIVATGPLADRPNYEWFGPWERVVGKFETKQGAKGPYQVPGWGPKDEEGCGVRVWATIRGEGRPRELSLLLAQATVRNSTLWAGDPKQQLAYLALKRWARLYCPDVILGVYSPDEMEEGKPPMVNVTPVDPPRPAETGKGVAGLSKAVAGKAKPAPDPVDLAAVLGAPADLILGYLATRKEVALHVASLADLPPNAAKWLADNADTIRAAIAAWADGQAAE